MCWKQKGEQGGVLALQHQAIKSPMEVSLEEAVHFLGEKSLKGWIETNQQTKKDWNPKKKQKDVQSLWAVQKDRLFGRCLTV